MKIFTLHLGELDTNCYIIPTNKDNAVVVDPAADSERILKALDENGLKLKKILLTHGHFDHTGACADLVSATGADVYLHENDLCMTNDTMKNVAYLLPSFVYKPFSVDKSMKDGDLIQIDNLSFKVMHTPGHTSGSVIFICDDNIFAGDTIFCCSVGRSDFYSGDQREQRKSLDKIAKLQGDFHIYCGHGEATTLKYEKENNDFLAQFRLDSIFGE